MASAGSAGAAQLPTFSCGAPAAITWTSALSSQPTFFDAVSGASGDVGCSGSDFVQTIPRKAGKGQQETLKISFAEVFEDDGAPTDADLKFDLKVLQREVLLPDGRSGYDTYFDVTEFAFRSDGASDPFADLFLGLKITSLDTFQGDLTLAWDTEAQVLNLLVPMQDEGSILRLTSAPVIPEPETWALLTTGLVGIGTLMRRRRARAW